MVYPVSNLGRGLQSDFQNSDNELINQVLNVLSLCRLCMASEFVHLSCSSEQQLYIFLF